MTIAPRTSVLWLLTGVMVLIVAVACGCALSGAATAAAAVAGIREGTIGVMAVTTLLAGFATGIGVGLRDLATLARRGAPALPLRWAWGSLAVMFVVGPLWNLCVVHVQEPVSGSDAVRTLFDNVLYALVLTLVVPLGVGVPWALGRVRRQSRLALARGQA